MMMIIIIITISVVREQDPLLKIVQSDLVTTMPLIPSKSVPISWMFLCTCIAM